MATYERLINLYKYSKSITPLEDFSTEILTGILEMYPDVLNAFVQKILNLEEGEYIPYSQKHYSHSKDKSVFIDLVFESTDTICFLENKVESSEGENQLSRYSTVLDAFSSYKNTHLRYCTKYFDLKDESQHDFQQFRWSDIANLLLDFKDKPQIYDFYNFLKKYKMANNLEITAKELFLFENLPDTLSVLEELLEKIRPAFVSKFGEPSNPDYSGQMRKQSRYAFYKKGIFGDASNDMGAGIKFSDKPSAYIWLWTAKVNTKSRVFNELIYSHSKLFDNVSDEYFDFKQDLSSFLASSKPVEELENWFMNKFQIIEDFIKNTPELEWRVGNE